MASKRRLRRKQCQNKVKYYALEDARRALSRAIDLNLGTHRDSPMGVYRCHYGGHYHIGHRSKRQLANANR